MEVVCYYDDDDAESTAYAFRCEREAPKQWPPTRFCPRCDVALKEPIVRFCALSRRDNQTYICSPCGMHEALEDAEFASPYIGAPYWKESR